MLKKLRKNIIPLVLIIWMLKANAVTAQSTCGVGQIVKLSASSTITVDGNIDAAWTSIQANAINNLTVGTKQPDYAAQWRAAWDSNYLYILVEVNDAVIKPYPGTGADYNYDAVEIFISGNNNQGTSYGTNDFQYVFDYGNGSYPYTTGVFPGPNNGGSGSTITTGISYAINNITGRYDMEIKIPWSNIGITPGLNNNIGFDVAVDDNDHNAGTRDAQVEWNTSSTEAYHNPSLLGTTPLVDCTPVVQKLDSPQSILARIDQAYDSIPYLSFDVKYIYSTDTLNGNSTNEVLQGSFTMAGKKTLYSLGNMQFMQNDSFFVSVYNDEKLILVADPKENNASVNTPLRSLTDSIVQSYGIHYTISNAVNDSVGTINFIRADSAAQFDQFTITYYNFSQPLLRSISYSYQEPTWPDVDTAAATLDSSVTGPPIYRNRTFTIRFFNYRFDNFSSALYDETNYIWFENGTCEPVDKYKGYQIYYSRSAITH